MRSVSERLLLFVFGICFLSSQQTHGHGSCEFEGKELNQGIDGKVTKNIDYVSRTSLFAETYHIYLSPHLNPAENFTFDGIAEIKLRVLTETDHVVFNYGKLTLQSFMISDYQAELNIIKQQFNQTVEECTVVFDANLKIGSTVSIKIIYRGRLMDNASGLNINSYDDANGHIRWFATTHSEKSRARDIFPCLDEFKQVKTIKMDILRRKSQITAANMVLKTNRGMLEEELSWDSYENREPMSLNKIAILVADSPSSPEITKQLLNEWTKTNSIDADSYASSDKPVDVNKILDELIDSKAADSGYRLPITVIPHHYKIHLHPFIFTDNFTFDGTVEITATAVTDSYKITLHINEIQNYEISLTVNTNPVTSKNYPDPKYNFLTIVADELIHNGSNVIIAIKYVGELNKAMRGFYRSSYTDDKNNTKWLAATHLEPVGARSMFPCFDEPALKATFQIIVTRSSEYKTISNTKLLSTTPQGDHFVDTFEQTPIMSTYLVALVVSDFDFKSINTAYSAFARPNAINQVIYAASVMKPIVDYFEQTLEHTYQLPKLDMIALPDFVSGAMENWGLITYRESNMLYHSEHSPITAKQSIASVIAHEISHQWFGNLVSPQWWNYTWLSEGFARYYQYHATAEIEPDWGMENQFVIEQHQNSFETDASPTSHPLTYGVYSPAEISGIFDQISYGKGGSVLRMVEKVLGVETFHAALHDYLETRKYDYGTPEYLFEALQAQVDKNTTVNLNVEKTMDSWTTQAGFPLVDVRINGSVLMISQKRFLLRNPDGIDVHKVMWSIPITYTAKSKPNFSNTTPKSWLNTKTNSINLTDSEIQPGDWIIFNVQEAGYYRVNYDGELWNRVIVALKSENFSNIHELNRAALMDDVLNLARAGDTDYFFALSATQYLTQETNYIPWKAALNGLSYLDKQFTGKDIYELFKVHILTIVTPIYNKLGFNDVVNECHYDKLLRRDIIDWACEFGVKDCIDRSLRLFSDWRSDTRQLVPVNSRKTVYCTAIKYGTLEDYNFLWNKYLTTDVPAERSVIISALGCSKNATLLEILLMSAVDTTSPFRYQDIASIFSSVYTAGFFGAQSALNFIEQHHNAFYKYFRDYKEVARIFGSISSRLTTKESVLQIQRFVETNSNNFSTIAGSLNSYVTRAYEELTWYDKYSPRIFEWLDTTYPSYDYRLPKSIDPITYNIFLTPYLDNNKFTFDGSVTIRMNVNENISHIVLHAEALTISSIEVLTELTKLKVSNYSINSTTEKLTIYLTTTVNPATILTVNIKYSGILNNNMVGFYRSYYDDDSGTTHWLASTQFEKFGARQAFPCFDEPSFKAKFTVNIERPNHYHSLSNMPLRAHGLSSKVNYTWDYYMESEIMSSYLVAFIISDFYSLTNTVGNFKVWSRPNAIDFAKNALDIGQNALSFLEKYTGINYPISKMDLAAIPDFAAGAMENWGLVTFREYGLLTSENITSAVYIRYMATTIAHELVHMWFGNLVTCDWWEYLWLNEGFAEYLEYLVIDSIYPEWDMEQHFISYELQVALLKDSLPHMRAMNNKMETPFDDGKDFTSVAYPKSASVIHMMHRAFGKEIFAKGLQTYLDQNKYRTGKPEYLWSALQIHVDSNGGLNSTNESVATLMDSWASQPGYPVVHANFSGVLLTLTQERFLLTGKNNTSTDQLYWIPITIASRSDPNFDNISITLWLGKNEQVIVLPELKDGWFILNVQQSGYYRVNYEIDNWNRLIEALNEKDFGRIPEINRAQIIDDLLNLARAEYISYDLAFMATQYLAQELHHLPWKAFFNAYAYLDERFDGHEIGEVLRNYILELTKKVYENLGFEEASGDTQLIKTNRQLILSWVCKLNLNDCVEKSKKIFRQWRNSTNTFIPADAKPAVICSALRQGDYSDWNYMWKQYNASNFESDKIVILNSLGCTQNTQAMNQYLNAIFERDGSIRDQNVATAFSSIYSSGKFGVKASLEFLIANYTTVHDYYGSWGSVSNLFASVASKFSTKAEIDKLQRFINEIPEDLKEITNSLNATVKEAETSLGFVNKHGIAIKIWLEASTTTDKPAGLPGSSNIMNPSVTILMSVISVAIAFY